jgi:hypothetical protein
MQARRGQDGRRTVERIRGLKRDHRAAPHQLDAIATIVRPEQRCDRGRRCSRSSRGAQGSDDALRSASRV